MVDIFFHVEKFHQNTFFKDIFFDFTSSTNN